MNCVLTVWTGVLRLICSLQYVNDVCRFSIDAMQSVCLDEFGGEKAVPPKLQETTLIQHIFGGHLQSEVRRLIRQKSKFSGLVIFLIYIF